MNTIPLNEALEKATKGPLKLVPQAPDDDGEAAFYSLLSQTGKEVANTGSGDYPTRIENVNAALLAHCRNHLPTIFAAASNVLAASDMPPSSRRAELLDNAMLQLRRAIEAANQVEIP